MSGSHYLLRQGTIVPGNGSSFTGDILFSDRILEMSAHISAVPDGTIEIPCENLLIRPGGIDIHTHFSLRIHDQLSTADTFENATMAALSSGITTIGDFATQQKGESLTDCYLKRKKEAEKSQIPVYLHLGITDWRKDSFDQISDLQKNYGLHSIKLFTTYKDRGYDSHSGQILRALEMSRKMGYVVMVHCEEDDLITSFREKIEEDKNLDTLCKFRMIRPPIVEAAAIDRLCFLNQHAKGNLYIVHISTAEGIEILSEYRRKNPESRYYAETCPQYLFLDEHVFNQSDGYLYTCCPQIKSLADQQGLRKNICSKNFQTIATDHCPFLPEEKKQGYDAGYSFIPPGLPGTPFLLPLTYTLLCKELGMSPNDWVRLTASQAAEIFQLNKTGVLAPGYQSDIVIFDPMKKWTINEKDLATPMKWSPYLGLTLQGKTKAVFLKGCPALNTKMTEGN